MWTVGRHLRLWLTALRLSVPQLSKARWETEDMELTKKMEVQVLGLSYLTP